MSKLYKISVRFNDNNHGVAMNSFTWLETSLVPLPDAQVLERSEQWLNAIYAPLRIYMDTGYSFVEAQVDEISQATGETVRGVGGITPTIGGQSAQDMLPAPDAGSALARTAIPRVRGQKRFGGFIEGQQTDGLLLNPLLSALAAATTQWILGAALEPAASTGVWSSKTLGFVPFNGSGVVTNVPGTQVSRKPGRGA